MKVGFVLLSPRSSPIPSTRVAVLNMLPLLQLHGIDADIIFEPERPDPTPQLTLQACSIALAGYDAVCFQKVTGPHVLALALALRGFGIKTVFIVCDLVDEPMARACDATVVVTDYLRSLYPADLRHKVHVVHDGIEQPAVRKTAWRQDRGSLVSPLRAVLVTSDCLVRLPVIQAPPPWLEIVVVGRYPRLQKAWSRVRTMQWRIRHQPSWPLRLQALRFHLHPRIRMVPWTSEGVYDELRHADIGIIPIDNTAARSTLYPPAWQVKSENRLTLKMSVGLPVIATPIPAYESVVTTGKTAFFARSRGEWLAHLEQLRDPQMRIAVGEAGRAAVLHRYSMAAQAAGLTEVLSGLAARPD